MPTYATLPPRRPETVWSCRERRGRRCPLDPGFAVDEFFQGEERRRAWVRWSGFIVAFWRAWFTTSGDTNIGAKGGVSNQVEPPHSDTVRESQEFPEFWLAGLECANLGTYTYVHLRTLTERLTGNWPLPGLASAEAMFGNQQCREAHVGLVFWFTNIVPPERARVVTKREGGLPPWC